MALLSVRRKPWLTRYLRQVSNNERLKHGLEGNTYTLQETKENIPKDKRKQIYKIRICCFKNKQ